MGYIERQSWLLREREAITKAVKRAKEGELKREDKEEKRINKSLRQICPKR